MDNLHSLLCKLFSSTGLQFLCVPVGVIRCNYCDYCESWFYIFFVMVLFWFWTVTEKTLQLLVVGPAWQHDLLLGSVKSDAVTPPLQPLSPSLQTLDTYFVIKVFVTILDQIRGWLSVTIDNLSISVPSKQTESQAMQSTAGVSTSTNVWDVQYCAVLTPGCCYTLITTECYACSMLWIWCTAFSSGGGNRSS